MFNITIVEKEIAGKKITIETGRLAKQASGAVLTSCGGTSVLTTVCYKMSDDDKFRSFFPLTVNYVEKFYATGKIPGGFIKREGRISDRETLIARLTDRPIRPLFPKGFKSEVQVISTVLSSDNINTPDILSMIGASAALSISEVPFHGPVGAVKIGRINNEYVINPSLEQLDESDMEISVAGTKDAIMMVEGSAKIVPENEIVKALEIAHENIKLLVEMQNELVEKAGNPKIEIQEDEIPADFKQEITDFVLNEIKEALFIKEKMKRADSLKELKQKTKEKVQEKLDESPDYELYLDEIFEDLEYNILRDAIINEEKRLDDRKLDEIRQITCETSVLSETHGSALFTRGETQSLGIVTLGTGSDMQHIDSIEGFDTERFSLHYNFPPFSVGEARRLGPPKRREIGHGTLAKRAIQPVLPAEENFPYAIRVVSEIFESNGSSSQASVCSGSLCLMDAGVPISAPVAGIAMGLIKFDNGYKILSDILGTEDHLGDMDFKVAGTEQGITAIQMDIKVEGISFDIINDAITQAKTGRLHILNEMKKCLDAPREKLSANVPKIIGVDFNPDKIGELIGSGGKNIKAISELTGCKIDINDDNKVSVSGDNDEKLEECLRIINFINKGPEPGEIFDGEVKRVENYGVFVELIPGQDALLHISQASDEFVKNVSDLFKVGDTVKVKVTGTDDRGRIQLTAKGIE